MDSLYFLAMLAGIAWLAWWVAFPDRAGWSPFAMREDSDASPNPDPPPRPRWPASPAIPSGC